MLEPAANSALRKFSSRTMATVLIVLKFTAWMRTGSIALLTSAVDGDLTVNQGHEIGDAVETAVVKLLPGTVEVTGHLEPFGIDDDRLDDRVRNQAN